MPEPSPGADAAAPGAAQPRAAQPDAARRLLVGAVVLRLVVAAGLGIDAYVHATLAGKYDVVTGTISEGNLFRAEAALAAVAALLVLSGKRAAYALALVVAVSAVTALLANTYAHPGAIGPLPDMYEPTWFGEKVAALIGEAVAATAAAALGTDRWHRRRERRRAGVPRQARAGAG
jgi:hypothetical protein